MISADAIRLSMRARSFGSARSAVTLFLLRLNKEKKPAPEPISLRVLSPPGGSTLITSAPRSPRIMPQVGPMTIWVNSTTRIPVSGRRGCRDFLVFWGFRFAADWAVVFLTALLSALFLAMRDYPVGVSFSAYRLSRQQT